jgi:hypothetical protein
LLEFDRRFEVFPEFMFYDFNNPLSLPRKDPFSSGGKTGVEENSSDEGNC